MTPSDTLTILLVEDRVENQRASEAALRGLSERLLIGRSLDEACDRVIDSEIDVIVLGHPLAEIPAVDAVRRIRGVDAARNTPVLVLHRSNDNSLEALFALGAVDVLPHPFSAGVLRAKVRMLLDLARCGRQAREVERLRAWQTTLASIGDGVIATDAEGRVTFLNPVAEGLTGWSNASARGRPLTEVFRIVNETSRNEVENPALRALKIGTIVGLANHTILIARDGVEHPIDDSAAPIRNEGGTVVGAVLVFRDIAERKRAEAVKARLAAIVESSDDAIVGKDLEGTIQSWNRGAERIFGYTAAEVLGRSITLVIPPDRMQEEREILARLTRGERIEHFETQRVRKDGRRIDVAISISPIRDSEGHVVGAAKVARDVTDANRAAQTQAAALQAGEVGTYSWDVAANRVRGDANFAAIFGILPDEHASAPVESFVQTIHPDDRDRVAAEIGKTLESGVPFRSEYRIHGPSGERWVLARGTVQREPGSDAAHWAGVVVDITERKRAEEALAASRARLDYAVQVSRIGFWYCDLPFDVLEWDQRVKEHFWLPPDATVTIEIFYDRIHPDDREPTRQAIEASIARKGLYDVHYRTVDPATGAEKWIRAMGGTAFDDAGAPKRFDGVTVDVTAQRQAEAGLRESNERFEIVARATNDAVWDWDMRTDAVWWNEGITALFGHRPEKVGANAAWWYDQIHPEDRDRVTTGIHGVIDHGRTNWSDEYRFRKGDGTYAAVLDRGYAIHEGGKTVRLVGAMQDVTEQRRAQRQLKESEQRFRSLFESMDEGYCVVEPIWDASGRPVDYRYRMVNPALEKQTGLKDIVGRTALEMMPNHESGWIEAYAQVAKTGEPIRRTDRVADLDRWYDVSAFRIGEPGSSFVGVLFNDISDRKRSEALLREKDLRLKLLVDRARDYAVVVTDVQGRVIEWAGGAESITGFAAADIHGQSADVLFTVEDQAAGIPAAEMATAARDGRAEDKRWHQRKDGSEFYADGVMVPLRGDDGVLYGYGKVFRDVTDRKRAEDSVQFLADASASLAELVDYQSTLNRIANLAVGGFADWCVVDMVGDGGRRERLTVTASEPPSVRGARAKDAAFRLHIDSGGVVPHVLQTGEPEVVADLSELDAATASQGPDRIARLREMGVRSYLCVPLMSRGRVIGGMTFLSSSTRRRFGPEELRVAQNLSERVTIAIENAQLYLTLQEQDRRKDEFLATLAHELRNPLAPVRNGLQILRAAGPAGEPAAKAISMMDRQLGHITHLVDDLMDVARVSSGKVGLRKERISLRSVVDAALETSRQAIEAAGHHLEVRLPAENLPLDADRTRMVQVLANLLNNAAKYTPHGGRIVLSADREANAVLIRVADTGVGLPSDMLPRVFEMFTQVGASIERSQGGLGIGLTLVKRLVEMHQGNVWAESPGPGKGSTFTVRLPLAMAQAETQTGTPGESGRAANAPLEILVVDDNRDAAESLCMLLELLGHRVRTAHDGPEALKLLGAFRPRLILLDLGLPGMNGYEVARRIRESADLAGVTLAALTGWGQEEDRRRTREAGFDHHLVKPAAPEELERLLNAVRSG